MNISQSLSRLPGWASLAAADLGVALLLTGAETSSVSTEAYSHIGVRMLVVAPLFMLFLGLAIWNAVYVFLGWRKHKLLALLPVLSYAFAFMGYSGISRTRADHVFRDTPLRPDTYFGSERKAALEATAKRLLGRDLKRIWFPQEKPVEISWVSGGMQGNIEEDILSFLKVHEWRSVSVDDSMRIVSFGYYRPRTWYTYIYSQNALRPPLEMPCEITVVDIGQFAEIIRIARQGPTATCLDRKKVLFEPTIVYRHLEATLGAQFMERVKSYQSSDDLGADEKKAILVALNKHRVAESRLVEHPSICYGKWRWQGESRGGLNIAHAYGISDGFWVVTLMKQLLKDGVINATGDEGRLSIRKDLNAAERREVEWLHVGLMNFVYGDLLDKQQRPYQRKIADHWYFGYD